MITLSWIMPKEIIMEDKNKSIDPLPDSFQQPKRPELSGTLIARAITKNI